MRQDPSQPAWRLNPAVRRIVARFAEIVCPPELRTGELTGALLGEFELLLGVLPAGSRRAIQAAFVVFDQGARLYPRAHGRRFVRLADQDADAYFRAVLARRRGGLGTALQRIKGLVVMCYYELPEVKQQLAYRPDAYIAAVSRRRLASYGPQIRAGEEAVLAPEPAPDASAPPGPRPEGT